MKQRARVETARTRAVVGFAALVALSAFGGTVGLATGTLDLGHTLNQRLPLHSP